MKEPLTHLLLYKLHYLACIWAKQIMYWVTQFYLYLDRLVLRKVKGL